MLDKSLPFKNIIMRIPAESIKKIPEPKLPEGFSIRNFQPGDEQYWIRLKIAVLEFEREEGLDYFGRHYLPYMEDLQNRCFFVVNPEGLPVATAMAWYEDSELGHHAVLEWVSCDPEYQGLGLGRAVVSAAVRHFMVVEPGLDAFLHTQTWSPPAVHLYHKLGFLLDVAHTTVRKGRNGGPQTIYTNDKEEGIEIIRHRLPGTVADDILRTAIRD